MHRIRPINYKHNALFLMWVSFACWKTSRSPLIDVFFNPHYKAVICSFQHSTHYLKQ